MANQLVTPQRGHAIVGVEENGLLARRFAGCASRRMLDFCNMCLAAGAAAF